MIDQVNQVLGAYNQARPQIALRLQRSSEENVYTVLGSLSFENVEESPNLFSSVINPDWEIQWRSTRVLGGNFQFRLIPIEPVFYRSLPLLFVTKNLNPFQTNFIF